MSGRLSPPGWSLPSSQHCRRPGWAAPEPGWGFPPFPVWRPPTLSAGRGSHNPITAFFAGGHRWEGTLDPGALAAGWEDGDPGWAVCPRGLLSERPAARSLRSSGEGGDLRWTVCPLGEPPELLASGRPAPNGLNAGGLRSAGDDGDDPKALKCRVAGAVRRIARGRQPYLRVGSAESTLGPVSGQRAVLALLAGLRLRPMRHPHPLVAAAYQGGRGLGFCAEGWGTRFSTPLRR